MLIRVKKELELHEDYKLKHMPWKKQEIAEISNKDDSDSDDDEDEDDEDNWLNEELEGEITS